MSFFKDNYRWKKLVSLHPRKDVFRNSSSLLRNSNIEIVESKSSHPSEERLKTCIVGWGLVIKISLLLFLASGCNSPKIDTVHVENELSTTKIALSFRQIGDHLSASYFLAKSLEAGACENTYLPFLIESMIKSGRIHASVKPLERLCGLQPANGEAKKLLALVREIVGVVPVNNLDNKGVTI